MNKLEIESQLRELPVETAAVFVLRVGLRVLPWLAEQSDDPIFSIWPDVDRAKHLLAILLAYDVGLMAIWNSQENDLKSVARARRTAAYKAMHISRSAYYFKSISDFAAMALRGAYSVADIIAYIDSYPYVVTVAAEVAGAADTAAYADVAVYGIRSGTTKIDISGVGLDAYIDEDATEEETDNNENITIEKFNILKDFQNQIACDLNFAKENSARKLIESPIWTITEPDFWHEQLKNFKVAAKKLNCDFDIWLEWYDSLCNGEIIANKKLWLRTFLPVSIAEQSPKQINAYLTSIAQSDVAAPLNRVRVIFIGDGEVGKTSLVRVLYNEAVVEGIEAKTAGIDIREWQVPATPIKATFWDFGGQVMVHATHTLFLRESCLYILLVSSREKEKATERAEYWLEHVKSFGKSAPVLIVANKADKEPVCLDEGLLREKYHGIIKGFFQLSCTQAHGEFRNQFEYFKQFFCQQLQEVGLHQVQFQKAHFAVLENLRQRTPAEAFLTHQDYATLCQQNRVDDHGALDSAWLLDILDKLGVIVHFPDMPEMEEYILNPRWLTYGIYTIMYNEQPRMTRTQAIKLLASKPVQDHDGIHLNYAPGKCHIIFEAMRRYKLCYFLRNDPNQIIIPALLPSDIKQHGFDTSNPLEFRYDFESFLPRHLISELIVECHEDIANINDQEIVWQHGALLHNTTHRTQALIQADYHFRRLTIWLTQQPAAADYLAILRDRVERIVQRIDIKYKQNIRLPHEARLNPNPLQNEVEWANFKLILAQRNRGQTEYVSESETVYSIGKILGEFTPQATGGDTIINIHNSKIDGNVTASHKISGSLNQGPP